MSTKCRKVTACLLACILWFSTLTISPTADALEVDYEPTGDSRPSIVAMGMDLLIVRPLTFVLTVGGSVIWLVGLPMSALGGNISEVGDKMVLEPGRYTFVRPLGHMRLDNSPILGRDEKRTAEYMEY